MSPSFQPEERKKLLRWLDHGVELARTRLKDRARHRDVIWLLLADALDMMDRVPDQERRWLSSGTRSGGWNAVGLTKTDLIEIERIRIASGIKPFDGFSGYQPQRDDVERALGVLEWLRFTSRGNDHSLQKAAVLLARGSEDAAARIYRRGSERVRQTTYEIRTKTVGRILQGLRETFGVAPSINNLNFQEIT